MPCLWCYLYCRDSPSKHSLAAMPLQPYVDRDAQRRVSETPTWSKHLLHVCLCLKGEGKFLGNVAEDRGNLGW